jgi:hypothetical protein
MITPHFANQILDTHLRGFLALHTSDPGETGAAELRGRAYKRQAVDGAFAASASGLRVNSIGIPFDDLPRGEITHVALWDSREGGKLLMSEKLGETRKLYAGDALTFESGMLGFALD